MTNGTLVIASGNAERDHSAGGAFKDVTWAIQHWHPAILGIQEGKQYLDVYRSLDELELALPKDTKIGSDAQNNPILYDPNQVELLDCYNIPVHPGKAKQYPQRIVTAGKFRWLKDGSELYAHNTQVNSHIEHAGRPIDLPRLELSRDHLELLAEIMQHHGKGRALSFLNGDMNVDEDADNRVDWSGFPNQVFRERNIISVYDELHIPASFDTHGKRKIDVIASYKGDRRVKALKVLRSRDMVSDHRWVAAQFAVQLLG